LCFKVFDTDRFVKTNYMYTHIKKLGSKQQSKLSAATPKYIANDIIAPTSI